MLQTDVLDGLLHVDDMAKNALTERQMQEAMDRVSQVCDNYLKSAQQRLR